MWKVLCAYFLTHEFWCNFGTCMKTLQLSAAEPRQRSFLMYLLFVRRPDFASIWHLRQCEHSSAVYFHGFSLSDSHSYMNHTCCILVFASALVFRALAAGWHSAAPHLHGAGLAKLQQFPPVRSLALGIVGCAAKFWIRHRKRTLIYRWYLFVWTNCRNSLREAVLIWQDQSTRHFRAFFYCLFRLQVL